ncbi:unnamed protein product [Closterium sp. NIES-54]
MAIPANYLYFRIRELQKSFRLRIVLCHVDVDDVTKPLHDITKTALLNDCTLLCAWSPNECARYLETLKSYENKPANGILDLMNNSIENSRRSMVGVSNPVSPVCCSFVRTSSASLTLLPPR